MESGVAFEETHNSDTRSCRVSPKDHLDLDAILGDHNSAGCSHRMALAASGALDGLRGYGLCTVLGGNNR